MIYFGFLDKIFHRRSSDPMSPIPTGCDQYFPGVLQANVPNYARPHLCHTRLQKKYTDERSTRAKILVVMRMR